MVFLYIYPAIQSLWMSFTDFSFISPETNFIWFDNFKNFFTTPKSLTVIRNTVLFTVLTVLMELLIGLGVALLINREM